MKAKLVQWLLRKVFTQENLHKAADLAQKEYDELKKNPPTVSFVGDFLLFLVLLGNLYFDRNSPLLGITIAISVTGYLIADKLKK